MRPHNLTDQQLGDLYQEMIELLSPDDLEEVAGRHEDIAAEYRTRIQEMWFEMVNKHGISKLDAAKLVVLNGLSAMAVTTYRQRLIGKSN
jgi:hypothetical protein